MEKDFLNSEAEKATQMLKGKAVSKVLRHRAAEVLIQFSDGTRLFVDKTKDGVELSITGAEYEVQRILEWYPKEGEDEFIVGEEELKNITFEELRDLFKVKVGETDDPMMYNVYSLTKSQLSRIQKTVSHKIDLSLYDYSIAAYQKPL